MKSADVLVNIADIGFIYFLKNLCYDSYILRDEEVIY